MKKDLAVRSLNLRIPWTGPSRIPAASGAGVCSSADRQLLEDHLRLSEHRYRRIFEGSRDMIFVTSPEGVFSDVNQACLDLLGYQSKAELLSLESAERIFHNPRHWRVFKEQLDRHGSIRDFEACFQRKDGAVIHCLMSGNTARDVAGRIVGYEAMAKDVTARMDGLRAFKEQHRKLLLLHSVASAMNMNRSLGDTLIVALDNLLAALGCKSGGIYLIERSKSEFILKAQRGLLADPGAGAAGPVTLHDAELMRSLLQNGCSFEPQGALPLFGATLAGKPGVAPRELICHLITRKREALGFIAVEVPSGRQIGAEEHRLLSSLSNFLGSAVENFCLLHSLKQNREGLKLLTARLFHSQEEERKRIARELHDEAGQALTGINLNLETIVKRLPPDLEGVREQLDEVKQQINRTYQEMRRMSYRLHPAVLSDLGLEPALEVYLAGVSRRSALKIDFKMVGFEKRLDPETETVLYRIAQEVVTNTLKHSGAGLFKLSIVKGCPRIVFLAEDDGVGFDPAEPGRRREALGLLGMKERVALLGGNFSIHTALGQGTKIRIEIPLKEFPGE